MLTQLNVKIPDYIRKEYYINPDFARRCRTAIRTTLERLYDLEVHDGDTAIAMLKKKAEDLQQSVVQQRRAFESSQEELLAIQSAIREREEQLKAEQELEQSAEERESILSSLLSDRRAVEYAQNVRAKNLHVTSPTNVLKAIKTQFGHLLDEELLFSFLGKATGDPL